MENLGKSSEVLDALLADKNETVQKFTRRSTKLVPHIAYLKMSKKIVKIFLKRVKLSLVNAFQLFSPLCLSFDDAFPYLTFSLKNFFKI